ncbi:AAA family ATPase [Sinomonas flava]|uniref:AAA family ATPase n=1 Tax=Sinomonas flava TaxID=496857 RepID=UPI0039A5780F
MHLSMRVPWMDRPWDGAVCDDPVGNSSCVLLKNIGPRRDDLFEQSHAGIPIAHIREERRLPPCLSERATFMSDIGYRVVKTHPYAHNRALSVLPSPVSVPSYAFEAVPFRWLNRKSLNEEIGYDRVPGFRPEAEDAADTALKWDGAAWVMDGSNQQKILKAFFEPIGANSLVFIYLKHSPLQEQSSNRLLVGAAHVTDVQLPPMWDAEGESAFESSMWETIVSHSLRQNQQSGVLLPYQRLVALQDRGVDVSSALAWAPEGRDIEFSYVTEHVSDDAALQALASLRAAAEALPSLGLSVPPSAMEWLEAQNARLWKLRGPTPGLAAVLAFLGVERSHSVARGLLEAAGDRDVWDLLQSGFADSTTLPAPLSGLIGMTERRVWSALTGNEKDTLRLLSGMDISIDQVKLLLNGKMEVPVFAEDLLADPYLASICTYGEPGHIPFTTVDRACYPGESADWKSLVAQIAGLKDHQDRRRVKGLLVEVLEAAGRRGDTLLSQHEALEAASMYPLQRAPELTEWTLRGLELDSPSLRGDDAWPIIGLDLAGGEPALKLYRLEYTSQVIRSRLGELRNRPRFAPLENPRERIDVALPPYVGGDDAEDRAREEKAAGLAEMYAAPLSVLIGPAGTGKTTLLKALVDLVGRDRTVLLAPTGKARVQLATKVGGASKTLASFLSPHRFDGERYRILNEHGPRIDADLVVIDEASMLTEEMLAATLDAFRGVRRMVLVGDPRQLPPIGAGRPFVDLVNALRPDVFEARPLRIGPSYVELRVPRRQVTQKGPGESTSVAGRRADLELAAWFGDGDLSVDADQIWHELATDPDQATVRYERWGDRSLAQVLIETLTEELRLAGIDKVNGGVGAMEAAFALTYGGSISEGWLNWELGAGQRAETWQILSPTRSRPFGSTEINRHIKRTFRRTELELAGRNNWRGKNTPSPIGPEQIVRGDKVMATRNDSRAKSWPDRSGLNYVANGEIGVGIGRMRSGRKNSLWLNVEYSSQPGAQYSYRPTSGEDVPLELAWAVTVHKSQGSEFGLTFLILPARIDVSRELMYTALTRQRERVVILHEGTLAELRELSEPWRSETARRLTDLFVAPKPMSVDGNKDGHSQRFDGRIMHVAAGGVVVKSKNEVIVASVLDKVAPGRWAYEKPLKGADGRTMHPDFTIERPDGTAVLWEHLGLMDDLDYARKWSLKKEWYAANGFLPHPARGENGTLMWTDDISGVDMPAWRQLAADAIGTLPSGPARRGPRRC